MSVSVEEFEARHAPPLEAAYVRDLIAMGADPKIATEVMAILRQRVFHFSLSVVVLDWLLGNDESWARGPSESPQSLMISGRGQEVLDSLKASETPRHWMEP